MHADVVSLRTFAGTNVDLLSALCCFSLVYFLSDVLGAIAVYSDPTTVHAPLLFAVASVNVVMLPSRPDQPAVEHVLAFVR